MAEFTKDEALAFVESIRLTLGDRVGFKWLSEKLGGLEDFIRSTATENEQLNTYIDEAGARGDYDAFVARTNSE